MKTEVKTSNAPAAIGPYSQAIKVGDFVYTAGMIPLDPATGQLVGATIKDKARRVLQSLQGIIEASGGSMNDVVKTTIFLTDLNDFVAVNEVYAEFFKPPFPARSTVQVAALPKGAPVEIEAVAYLGQK